MAVLVEFFGAVSSMLRSALSLQSLRDMPGQDCLCLRWTQIAAKRPLVRRYGRLKSLDLDERPKQQEEGSRFVPHSQRCFSSRRMTDAHLRFDRIMSFY